jgi:MFS family permease
MELRRERPLTRSVRNALLADVAPAAAYGRAYGFERMTDNLGAVIGPLLALGLVAWLGVRAAIGLSVIPGLLVTIQAAVDLAASVIAGTLWTAVSPAAAFTYLVTWMLLALTGLALAARRDTGS